MGMAVVAVEKIEAELTGNQVAAETKTPPWSVMVAVERIRCWTKMVGGGRRTRRGRGSTRRMEEEAQQDDVVQQEVEQQVAIHVAQLNVDVAQRDDDDDAQWDVSGSGASGSRNVCLQGPTILPQRPILSDMRPLNRTDGEKLWRMQGGHDCRSNDILGHLCREHFPRHVEYAGVTSPAHTFDHYTVTSDGVDQDGREFNNKVDQMKQEI
ncbi:uncharacterized protein [Zea mays]|uniref:uncharacterized protein n=1 Tax=Zea mays TaxID=4577 RepID=UPI0009AA9529|nr:uncharacterized protein LOC109944202 [Zea mays]|eukprot:XP_020404479.1 uncharacterized protein LOC109944202 [Zea mays]